MIKLYLMGIGVIVAAIGLGLGIQHVMAFGDCNGCTINVGGHHEKGDCTDNGGDACNSGGGGEGDGN
jgi:hypothetical protein